MEDKEILGPPGSAPPPPVTAAPALLVLALGGLLLLQGVTVARLAAPEAGTLKTPLQEFSAARAMERLRRILEPELPHPLGTPANDRVREQILAELRELRCEPEVWEAWAWSPSGRGALTKNIIARVPGTATGMPILLLSHHDSVPAGPGASDDGMGVAATLEVVRALEAGPPLPRPVIVLITDGEELGLLGARAFVREHPLARGLGAVINLEARGTSGPSFMFETSPGSAWLIPLFGGAAPRPLCSSLFQTVYDRLPNDTDLTVFLEDEKDPAPAYNFGCIRDVDWYHTPLDDLAHLSQDTLQHHGDNALHLTRALAGAPLESLRGSRERLVYFDLFGLCVARWPERWTLPIAGGALLLLLGVVHRLIRAGATRGPALGWGALSWLGSLAFALALVHGASLLLVGATGSDTPWAASQTAGHLLCWSLAALPVLGLAGRLLPRAGAWGLWGATWCGWALFGVALAALLPGPSFLFIVPALVAGALGLLAAARPDQPVCVAAAWIGPCLAAAALWLPLARGLEWAMGLAQKLPVTLVVALLLHTVTPLLAARAAVRGGLPLLALLVALVTTATILIAGPWSPERPQRVNVVFEEDADRGSARWTVEARFGPVPRAMIDAAGMAMVGSPAVMCASAEPIGFAPPVLEPIAVEQLEGGARRVRVRARSPRGAWAISLRLWPRARSIEARGLRHAPKDGAWGCDLLGVPPDGLELVLELGPGEVEYTLDDGTGGVPASGEVLLRARPPWAVQSQQGDRTRVTRRGKL